MPQTLIMPVIFVLCVVGSYAIAQRLFDVYVMLAFGVIGFVLRQLNFPMAPLVLGIVLGDLLEKNLRRGLVLSRRRPHAVLHAPDQLRDVRCWSRRPS